MRNNVLFDLDHTLFDSRRRDHMIDECRRTQQWDDYHNDSVNDVFAEDAVRIFKSLSRTNRMCILTARPSKFREISSARLLKEGLHFHTMLMRDDELYRDTPTLKIELVRKYFGDDFASKILCVVDDREDVSVAFAEAGITTLQIRGRNYYV